MKREGFVKHRQTWGNNWLSVFEDLEIPWRQLTLQEFLDYDFLYKTHQYTDTEIEDEIFRLVCLEKFYSENLDKLSSGLISTVVAHTMMVSGPGSVEQISEDLNAARNQTGDFLSSAMALICSVFVAYKPEEVMALNYQEFMKKLALAERRLLEMGVMKEPLTILSSEPAPKAKQKRKDIESKMGNLNTASTPVVPPISTSERTVIRKTDMASTLFSGHDRTDGVLWQADALSGLELIYPEYFKQMKEGKKITPETINETRGVSTREVEEKHEKYVQKILGGEIKPVAPKFLIADKLEGQSVNKRKEKRAELAHKVKVKRTKG